MEYCIRHYEAEVPDPAHPKRKRYGVPWAGWCRADGTHFFRKEDSRYTAKRGEAGDLLISDPLPGSVWRAGRKDYNLNTSPDAAFYLFDGSTFRQLDNPTELRKALDAAPQPPEAEDEQSDEPPPPPTDTTKKKRARSGQTRTITLTDDELALVQQNADQAGLSVPAYLRTAATHCAVQTIDLNMIAQHTMMLDDLLTAVNSMAPADPINRELLEDQLETLSSVMKAVVEEERTLVQAVQALMGQEAPHGHD